MPSTGRVGLDAAIFSNVFEAKVPAGPMAATAASERLDQGGQPLKTLSRAIGAGMVGVVDSIDISPAARIAAAVAQKDATLTNSDGSPRTVRGVHPITDGGAAISQGLNILAGQGK